MEAFDDHEFDALYDTARTVRPYTVTGGRTLTDRAHLPLEALVRAVRAPGGPAGAYGPAPEMRRIVELTTDRILSVAELSAHMHLPLGVVRVLVGDLADAGIVVVHGAAATSAKAPATDLQVLKGVLDGISTL